MNKKMCITGRLNPTPKVYLEDIFGKKVCIKLDLPKGCVGVALVFESKKMAHKHYGDLKKEHFFEVRIDK